ncbi:plasmid partitioning protein RepB [Polycladidibacter hongkongensis]|uniref:plasmid partitioning protein RepB n=1 Tax=Polycladidibacter hongkongensis TaxID=1647556 RepID=UPI000834D387|nr:plasmid partitioning protein RepB [Pseudovibrio hongkongensis]
MNEKRKRNKNKLSAIMTGNNANTARAPEAEPEAPAPVAREKSAVGRLGAALHSLTEQRSEPADPSLIIRNLDAKLLLPSIATDRAFEEEDEQLQGLMESIKRNGQQVPVLVRPHPKKPEFYQIAYGHRRVKACQKLDIAVRAVVEDMSDEQLVIAQGKENEERKNLTYIQQCFFAAQLSRTFTREVVAAAVGAGDKTRVSKLTSIIRRVPQDLLEAVGSAPGIGRVKWENVAKACEEAGLILLLQNQIAQQRSAGKWQELPSVERFNWLHDTAVAAQRQQELSAQAQAGINSAKNTANAARVLARTGAGDAAIEARGVRTLKITVKDEGKALALSQFLEARLAGLLQEFEREEQAKLQAGDG